MYIRKTDFTPLFDEMQPKAGMVYAFVGKHGTGKTNLLQSLSARLVANGQKGIYVTTCDDDELKENIELFENIKPDVMCDGLYHIFGNGYSLDIIENEIKSFKPDFLVIDDLYKLPDAKDRNQILSGMKKLAENNGIYIIFSECSSYSGLFPFSIHTIAKPHFDVEEKQPPVEQGVIKHSDYVFIIKKGFTDSFDDYNFTSEIEVIKGNNVGKTVVIKDCITCFFRKDKAE